MKQALLEIRGLVCRFPRPAGEVRAVDGLDLSVAPGRTLGLEGESGSGKSMTALSILGLVPAPGEIVAGEVFFEGRDLLRLDAKALRKVRGKRIGTIFQEPDTALNPVFTAGDQIAEVLRIHDGLSRPEARERAVRLLARVGIADPARRARQWPHQLSGGMRQRVMIAMAIACEPRLLIADEATTALDVTLQAQVLELVRGLCASTGMSALWITHDLGVVAEIADEVAVVYAGRVVERAPTTELFESPRHPYTILMLRCLRELALPAQGGRRPYAIGGSVPQGSAWSGGCAFRGRCPVATDRCGSPDLELGPAESEPNGGMHAVRCHHQEEARGL